MFKRILIANRGEIALRIIRCCEEMGIETVIVYSTEDKNSLPVILATKSVCIGPADSKDSYLNQVIILEAAKLTKCDAIHPGYGFLSENADFAKKCEQSGIKFIGPSSKIISQMGDKQHARELMIKNGVNVVPGSKGIVKNYKDALSVAGIIGYPVLIKASAGGGGKGMRKAFSANEMKDAFNCAQKETINAFGNGDMYVEKLIINPKHIEFQILADNYGNIICLGERNCSIQRNNQKLLEETPSWQLPEELRKKMGEQAIIAAKACGYTNAGTVEFIVDKNNNFYFIEMNTRIQVEHPVTEMITGIDIIREQIRVAANLKLSVSNDDIKIQGHAIECRINAKTPGKVSFLHFPAGQDIRIESYLYNGCVISPIYDSMIAKIIVKGKTRLEAVRKMRRALKELVIEGIKTNTEYMFFLTYNRDFVNGNYDTSFYEKNNAEIMGLIKE